MLTITEEFLDGQSKVLPGYRVRNPTADKIVFGNGDPRGRLPDGRTLQGASLFVLREFAIVVGLNAEGYPRRKNRYLELTIGPKETVTISEPVANAIFEFRCLDCQLRWMFSRAPEPQTRRAKTYCGDETHFKTLVGGLCPQLVLVGDDGERVIANAIHPALTEAAPAPALDVAALEQRVLARLASQKSKGGAA